MFISQETYEVMVSYVLKVGFYQDPPENYFGYQRSFGARKDNPSFRDFGFNDNAIRNQKVFPPIVMLEITIKVILNFHVSLFHTKKKLKRTKCKPENANFPNSVSWSSTQACCYKNDNFILKTDVTFTKMFSNWLFVGKIPKWLDAVLSGNKLNENICGLAMLKQTITITVLKKN